MADATQQPEQPKGFAQLPKLVLQLWPYLPEHHLRLLPLVLSFYPNALPAQGTLAEMAGVNRQAVNVTINQLWQAGVLRVTNRVRSQEQGGGKTSNRYELGIDSVEAVANAIAWYRRTFPKTPPARRDARQWMTSPGAMYGPGQDIGGGSDVRSRTVQPMYGAGPDKGMYGPGADIKRQREETNERDNEESPRPAAAPPGAAAPLWPTASATPSASPVGGPAAEGQTPNAEPTVNQSAGGSATAPPVGSTPLPPDQRAKGKSKPRATAGAKRPARPAMDDALKGRICGGLEAMEAYLLYGRAAFAEGADVATLEPEQSNWRKFGTGADFRTEYKSDAFEPNVERWDTKAFMGYYWYRVSIYRSKRNIPLTLPLWSRLAGDVKNVLATMTSVEFHRYIGVVCQHFDLIKYMLRRAGETMSLDETSLMHGLVRQTANRLAQCDVQALEELYEAMYAAA